MFAPSDKHFIHGGIFLLANQLQMVGDEVTGEISSKQWFVLLALSQMDGEVSITRLSEEIRSSRQNTAVLLRQLEKKEMIERVPSSNDRRSQVVLLTAKGRETVRRISKVGQRFMEDLFRDVTDEEIDYSKVLFQKLLRNMDYMKGQMDET